MNLSILKITIGKDNKVYVCLKPPTERGLEPLSQQLTVCYTPQSLPMLLAMKEGQDIEP